MQKSLSLTLRQQPQSATPSFDPHRHCWFLLDRVRGEQTLVTFYQSETIIENIKPLLLGTPYTHLMEASPLLIKLAHTELSSVTYDAIQQERSGIFLQAQDAEILEHLQYLFVMNCEQQGQVYSRYYDPFVWMALQLCSPEQQRSIWGNISKAFTLMRNSQGQFCYFAWNAPQQNCQSNTPLVHSKPIFLANEFYEISTRLKLLNLLYQISAEENLTLIDERTDATITQLKHLTQYGIVRSDLLKRVLPFCIEHDDLLARSDVQHILLTEQAAYEKVEELEALFQGRKSYE